MIQRIPGRFLRAGGRPPEELVFAYKEMDRDVLVYAPWGVHYLLRLWQRRWAPADWFVEHGILALKEDCGFYRECKIAHPRYWFKGYAPFWFPKRLGPNVTMDYIRTYILKAR